MLQDLGQDDDGEGIVAKGQGRGIGLDGPDVAFLEGEGEEVQSKIKTHHVTATFGQQTTETTGIRPNVENDCAGRESGEERRDTTEPGHRGVELTLSRGITGVVEVGVHGVHG